MHTTKPTSGWARFGVYGKISDVECKFLDLATDYKRKLYDIYLKEKRDKIDLRNELWPELFGFLTMEAIHYAKIYDCKQEIKKQNSKQRTRNSITDCRDKLKKLEAKNKDYKIEREKLFAPYWNSINYVEKIIKTEKELDSKWYLKKNTSDLRFDFEKKYYNLACQFRLSLKELSSEYQKLGLISDIRTEVDDSIKQSVKKIRYYDKPDIAEVKKLSLQIKNGGCSFQELLDGKYLQLKITHLKNNLYNVVQRVGTKPSYEEISYNVKIHKLIPSDATIQRWTLCIDSFGKRTVSPTISRMSGFAKKTGNGCLTYDLNWREDGDELIAAYCLGENIQEEIRLPSWLCKQFRRCFEIDAEIDLFAKLELEFLNLKSGTQNPQRLERYAKEHPDNQEVKSSINSMKKKKEKRNKLYAKSVRARDNIYLHAVSKIRNSNSDLIVDTINVQEVIKNKKKNIKNTKDKLSAKSRQNRMIVAPGRLNELLEKSGLSINSNINCAYSSCICPWCKNNNGNKTEDHADKVKTCAKCGKKFDRDFAACVETLARGGVPLKKPSAVRKTDRISSYVNKLGQKQNFVCSKTTTVRKIAFKTKQDKQL